MSVMNFNLRGIEPDVMKLLKTESEKQNISVNFLILNCIEQHLGYSHQIQKPHYHDLEYLAGTWNEEDAKCFKIDTAYFERIDDEMWS